MSYRSADAALQHRIEEVDREIVELDERARALQGEIEDWGRVTEELAERVAREGPGGGTKGAVLLRIPIIIHSLLFVGALVIPLEMYIGTYVHHQPEETIIPLLFLAGPGLLASVVAWPYRHLKRSYKVSALAGIALVAIVIGVIALGLNQRLR